MTSTLYGFTDFLPPMQKALIEKRLTTHGKYNCIMHKGKMYSYPEYIRLLVKQGGDFFAAKENGKTKYGLYVDGEAPCASGSVYYYSARDHYAYETLTKTQYDFAVYLREHHFDDDAVAQAYIDSHT